MLNRKTMIGSVASLGLMLGIVSGDAAAQMTHARQTSQTEQTTPFRRLEQPLWVKGAVTTGGLALIGLEIWWFLLSKPKSKQAEAKQGIQEMTITVDGGYEPNRIVVQVGQPVRLNFLRKDKSSCLEQILIPDFHIAANLPLNEETAVEFTPEKAGEYTFTCGMNMFRGAIEVQASNTSSQEQFSTQVPA